MLPHVICPDGSVDIELLAGLQKPQGHLLDFFVLFRVFWVRDGRKQQMRTDGDIAVCEHLLGLLPGKFNVLFHIAPQRSTDKHQLRAVLRPFRRSLPKHGQILPNGLTQRVVIRSAGMIDIPVYIAMIIPQVGHDAAAEVRVAGDRLLAPHVLELQQRSVYHALLAV